MSRHASRSAAGGQARIRGALLTIVFVSLLPALANAQNQPPVADAGPDANAYTLEWLTLNGSAIDPDGDPIYSWSWEVVQIPADGRYRLIDQDTQRLIFLGYVEGDYVVRLSAWDGIAFTMGVDYATVHVADNIPPVAVATADETSGPAPLTICFDGTQSYDPEGAPLTYHWNFGDGSDPGTSPNACHTFIDLGIYDITFLVTDVRGATRGSHLVITVLAPAAVPALSPSSLVLLGLLLSLAGAAHISHRAAAKS